MKKPAEVIECDVQGFFEVDHREIDAIFRSVDFLSQKEAEAGFREFDRRLERHIRWEEEILFPAAAQAAPELEAGPLRVMRLEHEEIRREKAAAAAALSAGDGPRAASHAQAMARFLAEHNIKEEQVLYPACQELVPSAERERIMSRIRGA